MGLHRRELRAWAMYDWAVSSVQTTIMVAVFPVYFAQVISTAGAPSRDTQLLATANTAAAIVVALLAPVLGVLSDYTGAKKKFLASFLTLGSLAVSGLFFVGAGDVLPGLSLFVLTLICATASMVFYDALLPHVARPHEVDRVSTAGYALGYIGGGALLAANLAWILKPEVLGLAAGEDPLSPAGTLPVRLAFISVGLWWFAFTIPLFRTVREPAATMSPSGGTSISPVRAGFTQVRTTLRELRAYPQALLMLTAFLIYNDGIQTIIKMATGYGAEIGIGQKDLIAAV
ncbi:MAG: MFS transporter, partial [Gemmatimonadaceae bacterium]